MPNLFLYKQSGVLCYLMLFLFCGRWTQWNGAHLHIIVTQCRRIYISPGAKSMLLLGFTCFSCWKDWTLVLRSTAASFAPSSDRWRVRGSGLHRSQGLPTIAPFTHQVATAV
eukprot:TRINITY_DN19548_c0_g1_i1.p3 TRINITY_DN19548_c0_g1~~TRINITY_DN19548_c0_g1_i1.p3  ORF type:complete len:112 (+),score=3.64 TRINITY_DN19548_c0_g1_i1:962-1297(+)